MAQGKATSIEKDLLESLTNEFSDTQISRKLEVSVSTVFLWRKKYGIQSFTEKTRNRQNRSSGRVLMPGEGTPHKDINSIESTYFKDIDCATKAYFLGLIASDGSLHAGADKYLSIELKDPDCCVLEKLASELQSNSKLVIYTRRDKNNTRYGRLRVYNRTLVSHLKLLGITSNTTKNQAFWSLPESLRLHYLRGLMDGDGCIKTETKTLYFGSCSRSLIAVWDKWVSERLKVSCSITQKTLKSGKTFYTITFGGKPKEVLTWLYENNSVSIPRKRQEALRWLNG